MNLVELRAVLQERNLSELDAMNFLQGEAGTISDLCVHLEDIAPEDLEAAVLAITKKFSRANQL